MEVKLLAFVLLALQSTLIMENTGFKLIISQKFTMVRKKAIFTIMCEADVPLQHCQVREYWRDPRYKFVGGTGTFFDPFENNGLGRCGVYINASYDAHLTYRQYACRARSYGGDWQYDHQVVRPKKSDIDVMAPILYPPQRVFANPGTDITLTFTTIKDEFTKCFFKWPGEYIFQISSANYTNITILKDDKNSFCSITLSDLNGDSSGFVTGWAEKKPQGNMYFRITSLIVKTAPQPPVLTLNKPDGNYQNGETLEATCYVSPARPIAKITWFLGEHVIRNDLFDDSDHGYEWAWVYDPLCITQHVQLELSMADNGKVLRCRAQHIAWPGGVAETSETIFLGHDPSESNHLLNLTWFMIGVAMASLAVLLVVIGLMWCTYATYSWCFETRGCRQD